ncbi:LuxR C-terminal-related transcriptional regulator [Vreelandella aquamarina]|uniref:LuxR C-terminal-related transcriptional regulator n=1 Tax=Vreelandella aquamarina TaxID=77097 RepID=UPI0038508653
MKHSKNRRDVYLVTEKSPQTQLFVNYLADKTKCSIQVLSPSAELTTSVSLNSLLLIDSDHTDIYSLVNKWQDKLPPELIDIPIAALNVTDTDHALEILSCAKLKGVFYRKESLDIICKGIIALLDGELWMSRELMARLILFYRKSQSNGFRPACGLTHREMEIISLLSAGASNQQIAEKLFVSEHTVKSHLYNIFRKINVRNRIQALNWIQKNLGPIMPNINETKSSLRG